MSEYTNASEERPTPWRVIEREYAQRFGNGTDRFAEIIDKNNMFVASAHPSCKGYLMLIVRAVNSRDDLLAACKLAREEFKQIGQSLGEMTPPQMVDCWNAVEAAIAKAEGVPS